MNIPEILNSLSQKKDLESGQATLLMRNFMEGNLTHAQMAAFLIALKMKGETPLEIAEFALEMRREAIDVSVPGMDLIDTCGTGGDGLNTFNISTAAALIAGASGCKIAKHGNRSLSSRCGSADVLQALGIPIEVPPERLKLCLQKVGIAFLFAPLLHPAMGKVMPVRKELGIRTVFNMLGPLVNPARVQKQMIGVYDEKLCTSYAEILQHMGHREAYVVHGKDGLDEVSLSGPTTVVHLKNNKIETFEVTPEQFGIKPHSIQDISGVSAEENAHWIREILTGEKGSRRDIACLNAAFAIKLSGIAPSLKDAYDKACGSIDSGLAQKKLEEWIAFFKE
jgi:anthranilate phosphoribosyltransferase